MLTPAIQDNGSGLCPTIGYVVRTTIGYHEDLVFNLHV